MHLEPQALLAELEACLDDDPIACGACEDDGSSPASPPPSSAAPPAATAMALPPPPLPPLNLPPQAPDGAAASVDDGVVRQSAAQPTGSRAGELSDAYVRRVRRDQRFEIGTVENGEALDGRRAQARP